jgi:hypothetical protein
LLLLKAEATADAMNPNSILSTLTLLFTFLLLTAALLFFRHHALFRIALVCFSRKGNASKKPVLLLLSCDAVKTSIFAIRWRYGWCSYSRFFLQRPSRLLYYPACQGISSSFQFLYQATRISL